MNQNNERQMSSLVPMLPVELWDALPRDEQDALVEEAVESALLGMAQMARDEGYTLLPATVTDAQMVTQSFGDPLENGAEAPRFMAASVTCWASGPQ